MTALDIFTDKLSLDEVLTVLRAGFGGYELVHHWKQGEFHHDVVLSIPPGKGLPPCLVVATNCNGGVKEILAFDALPSRDALWHWRCPDSEFDPEPLPELEASHRTSHFFDPCELLRPDARSELRPEHRRRQRGGGWIPIEDA